MWRGPADTRDLARVFRRYEQRAADGVPFLAALMGSVWQRIKDPRSLREKKIVVIDEAWSFLAHPAFFRWSRTCSAPSANSTASSC